MPEYITKERARDLIVTAAQGNVSRLAYMISKLEDEPPADVVEVVRCKDCEHYTPWSDTHDYSYGNCDYHDGENVINNGFCSEGKRKDRGEDL